MLGGCEVCNGPHRRYGVLTGGDDWEGASRGGKSMCREGRGKFRSPGGNADQSSFGETRELAESHGDSETVEVIEEGLCGKYAFVEQVLDSFGRLLSRGRITR